MISTLEKEITFRFLKARKKDGFLNVISIFSFIGISLGVAVLIIVMSVMNGFRTELIDKIVGFNAHAVVKPYDKSLDFNSFKNNAKSILSINSDLNPFMTDITIIRTATPRLIPMKEKIDITFKKPSFFLAFKNLKVISFSKVEIKLNFFV